MQVVQMMPGVPTLPALESPHKLAVLILHACSSACIRLPRAGPVCMRCKCAGRGGEGKGREGRLSVPLMMMCRP